MKVLRILLSWWRFRYALNQYRLELEEEAAGELAMLHSFDIQNGRAQ